MRRIFLLILFIRFPGIIFCQVEADPSELNLTSYETFFEEKRPFFLESRDIFDFSIAESQLFYSRRIGQQPGVL